MNGTASAALLDTVQLAGQLGLRPNTLAQWRVTGAGPRYILVGRRVRYRQADVDVWLDMQARRSTCDPGSTWQQPR